MSPCVVRQALVEGSSACNSGIVPGDCLMEVNGKNVYCKGIEMATKVHTVSCNPWKGRGAYVV